MSEKRQYDIPTPKKEEQDSASSQELKRLGLSGDAIRKVNNLIEDNVASIGWFFLIAVRIVLVGIWVIVVASVCAFVARIAHLFVPIDWIWLTADRIKEIDSIFIGLMAGLLSRTSQFMTKFIQESKNKKDH